MTRMFVNAKVRAMHAAGTLQDRLARGRDAGQGTLEYLGIVIIAVILVGAVIAAVNKFQLTEKIVTEFGKIGQSGT